ncbi:MAG: aminoglycoside phosphotransferase family protein [Actinobacteria bacterium]|nr:aminoglycoside phosphotransferase family protein [Actinomycetota bacterium]
MAPEGAGGSANYQSMVGEVVAGLLGEAVERVEPIDASFGRLACRVHVEGRSLIFKSSTDPDDQIPVAAEAWGLEEARRLDVPGPAVIALDTDRRRFPADFLLIEEIPGIDFSELMDPRDDHFEDPATRSLLVQTGGLLRRLHSRITERFGPIDPELIQGKHPSWHKALVSRVEHRLRRLQENSPLNPSLLAGVWELLDERASELDGYEDPRLIHGDFQKGHVIVDPERTEVTGVIDFEDVASGDPIWDLATFSKWEEESLSALLEGYEPDPETVERLDQLGPVYRVVLMVGAAAWFVKEGLSPRPAVERLTSLLAKARRGA